jgi:hypothetical protein
MQPSVSMAGLAGPILQTLQPQGTNSSTGPQFNYPKTLKTVLAFIKLFFYL